MTWLRERKVLLPGVTTLARLVARVREDTTHRLWRVLETLLTPGQRRVLDRLLEVSPGLRVSDLERWRKGPPPRGSGPAIIQALDQVAEIQGLGLAGLGAEAVVPPRRLGELARYGMTADAWLIRRHPDDRRLATLLATTRYLEAKSVDDALELLDLQPEAQVVPGGEHEPQLRRCTHHQQLELAQRLRAQLVHVIDHQPEPVVERAEILQQPLDNRPAVQIRCRRQLPHQRRPGRGVPQRVGHRDPEPLRIVLLALDRHPGGALRQARLPDPGPQQERLPTAGRRRYLGEARCPPEPLEQLAAEDDPAFDSRCGTADGPRREGRVHGAYCKLPAPEWPRPRNSNVQNLGGKSRAREGRGVLRSAYNCRAGLNSAVLAHNPEVAGSNPAPATGFGRSGPFPGGRGPLAYPGM
jgi:hypothetical protein